MRSGTLGWMLVGVMMAGALAQEIPAQEEMPPLLLDDSRSRVRVRTDRPAQPKDQEPAKPTPRPEDVIVALVNGRVLTQAELEVRVSQRFEKAIDGVQSRIGGVLGTFNPGQQASLESLGEQELLEEQKEELQKAMAQEEGDAITEWMEFSMLAEEAKRQGIIVSESEFRSRLENLEQANKITGKMLEDVLTGMRMTRADYERSVYDALMIEKMLRLFISLNYDEDYLRAAYDANPAMFYKDARYRVAHFAIALEPNTDRRREAELRALARKVQSLLKKGDHPDVVFRMPEFDRLDDGIYGDIPGWFSFKENTLPRIVEWHGQRMKLGQTSEVIENKAKDDDGRVYLKSLHVIQTVEFEPETGRTFESALPTIEERMIDVARIQLLSRLYDSRTHKLIVNVRGIRPEILPTREQLIEFQAKAQPISLKLPTAPQPPRPAAQGAPAQRRG